MLRTYGELKAAVERLLREQVTDDLFLDVAGDAVENLWMSYVQAFLDNFLGGPTTFSLSAGAERINLASIADPVAALNNFAALVDPAAWGDGSNYSFTYTYVTESGSETLESPELTGVVPVGSIATFYPPQYISPLSTQYGVVGWNLYAGRTPGARTRVRQNDVPIPFTSGAIVAYQMSTFRDVEEGPGRPVENTTGDDIFFLKDVQTALSGGRYQSWQQADLSSTLFKKAAGSIAANSEYQTYVYDLINNRTLEVRPLTAGAQTPRYFYIYKPRRSRFMNAKLPFASLPSEAFLKYKCLDVLSTSVREFDSADRWAEKAEHERILATTLAGEAWSQRNRTVRPMFR